MRKMLSTLTAVIVLMGISAVSSWSQHGHGGKEVTITGEVIGTVCYVRHDAKGEKHKTCALACAKQGIPLGILEDETNKIYLAFPKGHGDPNAAFVEYIAMHVKVTGVVSEKGGLTGIEVKTIEEVQ